MPTGRSGTGLEAKDRCFEPRACSNSFWRIAVLTAAGAIGVASRPKRPFIGRIRRRIRAAAPEIVAPTRQRKFASFGGRRRKPTRATKIEAQSKEAAKPHGPLVISISIDKQNVKIYDANGFFAETPVSTGMRGHPTPMGVFSVIAKEKLHHSNIYSGAPMPLCSGSPGRASPSTPACFRAIRHRMAVSVCRCLCREDVWLDHDGRAGRHHARRDGSEQFLASVAGRAKVVPQPVAADEPKTDAARPQRPTRRRPW